MMSIRQRKWKARDGSPRQCWVVDYRDHSGRRHLEHFNSRVEATVRHAELVGVFPKSPYQLKLIAGKSVFEASIDGNLAFEIIVSVLTEQPLTAAALLRPAVKGDENPRTMIRANEPASGK